MTTRNEMKPGQIIKVAGYFGNTTAVLVSDNGDGTVTIRHTLNDRQTISVIPKSAATVIA